MTRRELITECLRAVDDRRFDELARYQTESCTYAMNHDSLPNPAAFAQMCEGWYGGFPDLQHQVLDVVEDGDRIAYTVRVTGTHTGTMLTPQGPVPATGKRIDFRSIDVVQIGPDGRATSWHVYFDMLQLLQQLGLA